MPFSLPQQRGFTLVELVVTIILIGILSISVLPRLLSTSSVSGFTVRDEVISELRRAQLMAMNNADRCYRFNVTAAGYQIEHYDSRAGNRCSGDIERRDERQSLTGGATLTLDDTGNQVFALDFNRQGQAFWGAGNNDLCAGKCIEIDADDSTSIDIESQGYIHAGI